MTEPKICPICKNELEGKRVDALYCSANCKLIAYYERRGGSHKQPPQHTECQREDCTNKIPESAKSTAKYCSNACRQKVYNEKNKEKVKAEYAEKGKVKKDAKAVEEFIQELMK